MQHKSDIEDAIAKRRVADIEDAFRALVGWPKEDEIKGLSDTEEAIRLLKAVALALIDLRDERQMPVEIVILLEEMAEERGQALHDATYESGAEFVRVGLGRWRLAFDRTFREG